MPRHFKLCAAALLLIGCGHRDASLAEVRGDVTFCGQPAIAEVLFEPLAESGQSSGRASSATTDDSGQFRMMLDDTQAGAKIGRHRITIRVQRLTMSSSGQPASKSSSDGVIGVLKRTQLAREVRSGPNEFHFRLTY